MKYDVIHASVMGSQNWGTDKGNEDTKIVDKQRNIYILADGMGGHEAGKTASLLASQFMYNELQELRSLLQDGIDINDVTELLSQAVGTCNNIITAAATNVPDVNGMGTTLDTCLIHEDSVYFSHVGNGRMYLNGKKLTREHVNYPPGHETLLPEEQQLLERNLGLTSYIGAGKDTLIDLIIQPMEKHDLLLMATDGLTHTVTEVEMQRILRYSFRSGKQRLLNRSEKPYELAKAYARKHELPFKQAQKTLGGKDNTSFIAVKRTK